MLDLDETLVHSSFKMMHPVDYIVPVEIENQAHNVYVIKRPGVDEVGSLAIVLTVFLTALSPPTVPPAHGRNL